MAKSMLDDYIPQLQLSSEGDQEIIPIITDQDDSIFDDEEIPTSLPILPLRNTVLFPGVVIPLTVGRDKSFKLVNDVYASTKVLGTVSQIEAGIDDPELKDLYGTGTLAQILKIIEMPDDTISVIIQGRKRIEITEMIETTPYFRAKVRSLPDLKPYEGDKEFSAIVSTLKDLSLKIIKLSNTIPKEAAFAIKNIENHTFLINFICSNSDIDPKNKQSLLEIDDLKERAISLMEELTRQIQMLELKNEIQSKVRKDLDQQQKEFLLHQQMKTIQEELGGNPIDQEIQDMKERAKKMKWNEDIAKYFEKEVKKLSHLNPAAGEYSVQINYLHTMLDLPWNEFTKDKFDLKYAENVLNEDHYGLDDVKERILEHLAVLKLKGDLKAPILCLYGPPGVGKTSLGKSVARALGRKYARMSLGGLHDESEIRGHRKTYIGAMPGRILQNIKKVKSSNPVFVLDEIDKVGSDFRGDPSSALLEVLDPEQNSEFHDNFIEVEFDLSKVMFIATANTTASISPALRDRMEMIEVSGYVTDEKVEIAKRHLIPKQIEAHGLNKKQFSINDKAIVQVIEQYTRESGVRQLDKVIAKIARQVARKIAVDSNFKIKLTEKDLETYLGHRKYFKDQYQGNEFAGVVTGLAWTATGGDILYIETSLSNGKGNLALTGNLGDVMKESATIALEYIKAHADLLDINPEIFKNWNIHLHVPEGAIPKDGPSAGITMAVALASAITQRKVMKNLAMTGEITLRGKVLPVGGIKEKILAAKRAGIKEIILSQENEKDIDEINPVYIKGLTFHYVKDVKEVLNIALLKSKITNPKVFV
jgi:ATP-dependent Lon protease